MIIQNQIRCKKCGDEPFSASRHNYVSCKCGAVAVDGGLSYLKRTGNPEDCEEMSYSLPDEVVNECISAVAWARDTGRNDLGVVFAILRSLKKHDRLLTELEI